MTRLATCMLAITRARAATAEPAATTGAGTMGPGPTTDKLGSKRG